MTQALAVLAPIRVEAGKEVLPSTVADGSLVFRVPACNEAGRHVRGEIEAPLPRPKTDAAAR